MHSGRPPSVGAREAPVAMEPDPHWHPDPVTRDEQVRLRFTPSRSRCRSLQFHRGQAMKTIKSTGSALAIAAAAMFAVAPMMATAGSDNAGDKGHCMGANACKGQSACATANNACKGQNACKGTGFTEATADECAAAGGEFKAADAKKEG